MSAYRQSMVPPSTVRRTRVQEPFPVLDFGQIAEQLNEVAEYGISEELLIRPTQQYVCKLYGDIIDWFLGISQYHLRTALESASKQLESPDSIAESRVLMGLHRHVYKFLVDCGVDDFNIMDLVKPEPNRLRRMLSAVVGFAIFREDRMKEHADIVEQSRKYAREFESLESQHEVLTTEIQNLEEKVELDNEKAKQISAYNQQVETELRKLKKVQEELTSQHSMYKQKKQALVQKLEDENFLIVTAKKSNEKIRPYIVDSPDVLHKINADMAASLQLNRLALDALDNKLRALDVTSASMATIEGDIQACIKAIEECEVELQREQEALRKQNKLQDNQERLRLEGQDVDVKIQQLNRQLDSSQDRIRRAHAQRDQKKQASEEKISQLYAQHGTLIAERNLVNKQIDEKTNYIESMESRIRTVIDDLDSEMRALTAKCEQLNSHVTLYLENMEQRI